MTKIKKIAASCMAALGVFSLLCTNVSAETRVYEHTWSATGRRITGAPTSVNSVPDYCTIWHMKDDAKAITLGITHTKPNSKATITIKCRNYTMDAVQFVDYEPSWKQLYPSVGKPTDDIDVKYEISVSTDTTSDSAVSTGIISKIRKP